MHVVVYYNVITTIIVQILLAWPGGEGLQVLHQ